MRLSMDDCTFKSKTLSTEEVCQIYGISRNTLEQYRRQGAPSVRVGKSYEHDAEAFDLWYRHHKQLANTPAIGCREVVTGDEGVLGIIDLTGRWFPTVLLLILCCLVGCSGAPSVEASFKAVWEVK